MDLAPDVASVAAAAAGPASTHVPGPPSSLLCTAKHINKQLSKSDSVKHSANSPPLSRQKGYICAKKIFLAEICLMVTVMAKLPIQK